MKPTRVLVAEDSKDFRALLGLVLERAGYAVKVVSNGQAALATHRTWLADIVVTDLYMPGGHGVEAIAALRKEFPGLKIIAMSAGVDAFTKDDLAVATIVGADVTLRKPFEMQALIEVIASMAASTRSSSGTGDAIC